MYTSEQYKTEVSTDLGLLRATANAFESVFARLEALEAAADSSSPGHSGEHQPPKKPK